MSFPSLIEGPPSGLTLLSYHRMGAASGTTETDASGNGHAGSYAASGVTLGAPGALVGDADTAAQFDGTAGLMSVPLDLSAQSKITIMFACKYNGSTWPTGQQQLIGYGPTSTVGGLMFIAVSGGLQLGLGKSGGTASKVSVGPLPSTNAYHLFTITIDRTAATQLGQLQAMVDGAQLGLGTISGYTTRVTGNFANASLYVAAMNSSGTMVAFAPVTIDEVAVFSGIMSLAQHQQLYAASLKQLEIASISQPARLVYPQPITSTVAAAPTEGSVSYAWTLATKPVGSTAVLSGQGTDAATVNPDLEGIYGLECVASDTGGNANTVSAATQSTPTVRVLRSGAWKPGAVNLKQSGGWV